MNFRSAHHLFQLSFPLSLLIISLILGACAHDGSIQPLLTPKQKQELTELELTSQQQEQSVEDLLKLARLLTQSERHDQAGNYLNKAMQRQPDNPLVQVWWGHNQVQQSLEKTPWYLGLRKQQMARQGMEAINWAVVAAPDDVRVRLVRMETLILLKNRYDYLNLIFADKAYFDNLTPEKLNKFTPLQLNRMRMALAEAFWIKAKEAESAPEKLSALRQCRDYLQQVKTEDPNLMRRWTNLNVQLTGI